MVARKTSKKFAFVAPTKTGLRKAAPNPINNPKKAKVERQLKQIFKDFYFSCSGNFGGGWEHEKIANWVRRHGGYWETKVTDDTTHLICTIEDYKKETQQVRAAQRLGSQCNIIVQDWLDDCLAGGEEKKKRARPEKDYTLDQVLKRVDQSLKAREGHRASFEAGVRAAHELVDNSKLSFRRSKSSKTNLSSGLHHIYYDSEGFEYKIVCTRINDTGRIKSEKYIIYLFESIAKPHSYMAGAKLTSHGRQAALWRTECHPKQYDIAFRDFQQFFHHVTGIAWDDRCDGITSHSDKFRYHAPSLGRPVGALPAGKKPPGFLSEDEAVNSDVDMTDGTKGLTYDTMTR